MPAPRLRVVTRREQEEADSKKQFSWAEFGRGVDHILLEGAVHIPVAVAVGISCYGYSQYGLFAIALQPMAVAFSFLLSRTYSMAIKTHRIDVAIFLTVIGALTFVMEAFGVHLGLARFEAANAATGLQTFGGALIIVMAITLGLMNLFSRRAFITGHQALTADMLSGERWWKWGRRRSNWMDNLERTEGRDAFRIKGDGQGLSDDMAVKIFAKHGAFPIGYKPTEDAIARTSHMTEAYKGAAFANGVRTAS